MLLGQLGAGTDNAAQPPLERLDVEPGALVEGIDEDELVARLVADEEVAGEAEPGQIEA